jgi:hypothetical protein
LLFHPQAFFMKTMPHAERRLLIVSALGTLLGYGLSACGYFIAPMRWSMSLEHWFYRHFPLYHECQTICGAMILMVWLIGCVLLCHRAWTLSAVPWSGVRLAALTPMFALCGNALFLFAARHVAPMSVHLSGH